MRVIPIPIKSSSIEQRVKLYLETIYKFHKLTDKEVLILIEFIVKYYEIITKYPVHDAELVNKLLFDIDVRKKIRTKLNIKPGVFENYLTSFRKRGVIVEKGLNPAYIPPKEPFKLEITFL